MNSPLLSVVVPTKNRYKYLKYLIQYFSTINSSEIELVIQDNTDDNKEITDFLVDYAECNINYYHFSGFLSMSENSDKAINNSKGEFICFIGDDDIVISDILNQVKEMKEHGYQAMLTRKAIYNWPDYKDNSYYHLSSTLTIDKKLGKNYLIDTKAQLEKVTKSGFLNLGLLPKVYQAVVARNTLNLIYKKCGTYFPGPSPDMANAIALSSVIDKVWYNDIPTIVTGQSKFVGGGERLMSKLVSLSECPYLPKNVLDDWDCELPSLWCTETIWPGSAYIAAKKMGINLSMNYNKIYAYFITRHPAYKEVITPYKKNDMVIQFHKRLLFFKQVQKWLRNRISFICSGKTKIQGAEVIRGLNTTIEVAEYLTQLIKK